MIVTKITNANTAFHANPFWNIVLNSDGILEIIPPKITNEIPLANPLSSINSPTQVRISEPTVIVSAMITYVNIVGFKMKLLLYLLNPIVNPIACKNPNIEDNTKVNLLVFT